MRPPFPAFPHKGGRGRPSIWPTQSSTAREDSDVDVLVAFDGPATSQQYFGVQFYLEDLFGHPVDLVTEKAQRPQLRPFIEKEAVVA